MMIPRPAAALALVASLALAACGDPSPDTARKKLAEQNVPVDNRTLIEQTKDAKSQETAKLLVIAGADPNAVQDNGMTALMSAVFNNQLDVAKALIERGARVNAEARGFTALRLAVERNNPDMVKLLLANGADPALRPKQGLSALDKAEGNAAMLELLRAGAKK